MYHIVRYFDIFWKIYRLPEKKTKSSGQSGHVEYVLLQHVVLVTLRQQQR